MHELSSSIFVFLFETIRGSRLLRRAVRGNIQGLERFHLIVEGALLSIEARWEKI
jgi:hypothetical protein